MLTSFFFVIIIRHKTQIILKWYEWRIEVLKRQAKDSWYIADFYSDRRDEKRARRWIAKALEKEKRCEKYICLKQTYFQKGGK